MVKLTRTLGTVLLVAGCLLIGVGALGILLFQGPLALLRTFDPTNIVNALVMLVALAPGIGLRLLADRLEEQKQLGRPH